MRLRTCGQRYSRHRHPRCVPPARPAVRDRRLSLVAAVGCALACGAGSGNVIARKLVEAGSGVIKTAVAGGVGSFVGGMHTAAGLNPGATAEEKLQTAVGSIGGGAAAGALTGLVASGNETVRALAGSAGAVITGASDAAAGQGGGVQGVPPSDCGCD